MRHEQPVPEQLHTLVGCCLVFSVTLYLVKHHVLSKSVWHIRDARKRGRTKEMEDHNPSILYKADLLQKWGNQVVHT
jgi:hypothetical protein